MRDCSLYNVLLFLSNLSYAFGSFSMWFWPYALTSSIVSFPHEWDLNYVSYVFGAVPDLLS